LTRLRGGLLIICGLGHELAEDTHVGGVHEDLFNGDVCEVLASNLVLIFGDKLG